MCDKRACEVPQGEGKPTMEDRHLCGEEVLLGGTGGEGAGAQRGAAWRYHAVFDGHDGDAAVRAPAAARQYRGAELRVVGVHRLCLQRRTCIAS